MAGRAEMRMAVVVNNEVMHRSSCLDARQSNPVFELLIDR